MIWWGAQVDLADETKTRPWKIIRQNHLWENGTTSTWKNLSRSTGYVKSHWYVRCSDIIKNLSNLEVSENLTESLKRLVPIINKEHKKKEAIRKNQRAYHDRMIP